MMKITVSRCFIAAFQKSHHATKKAMFLPTTTTIEIRNCYSNKPRFDYNINPLTKSMTMLSPSGTKFSLEKSIKIADGGKTKSLQLTPYSNNKQPLVVLLPWLMSQPKQYNKYAELYLQLGFDVLTVSVSPWQVWWPITGSQMVAKDLLGFLESNSALSPLLIHGFSVGGYLWGELLTHVNKDPERYSNVMNRISGHIWDSFADVRDAFAGFPYAMFPTNPILRKAFESYLRYHMKTNHETVTQQYIQSCRNFHINNSTSPALLLVSRQDPIGTMYTNTKLQECWESSGVTTYMKVWEDSPHVKHYIYHPEEYVAQIDAFLSKIQLLPSVSKIQAVA